MAAVPAARPTTVAEFLAALPPARRKEAARVRALVNEHLPAGYQETLTSGMIVWVVPIERYPDTYNGHPRAQTWRARYFSSPRIAGS
jgi:hypothetical protein